MKNRVVDEDPSNSANPLLVGKRERAGLASAAARGSRPRPTRRTPSEDCASPQIDGRHFTEKARIETGRDRGDRLRAWSGVDLEPHLPINSRAFPRHVHVGQELTWREARWRSQLVRGLRDELAARAPPVSQRSRMRRPAPALRSRPRFVTTGSRSAPAMRRLALEPVHPPREHAREEESTSAAASQAMRRRQGDAHERRRRSPACRRWERYEQHERSARARNFGRTASRLAPRRHRAYGRSPPHTGRSIARRLSPRPRPTRY